MIRQCERERGYFADEVYKDRLQINKKADKRELEQNKKAAAAIVSTFKNTTVKIARHSTAENTKNPEYIINDLIADRK